MYSASLGLRLREGEMCPHAPVLRRCAGPQRWHCRPVQTCRNHSVSAGSWWGPTVTPVLKSWRPREGSMFIGADKGFSGTSGECTHRWGEVKFLCRALTTSSCSVGVCGSALIVASFEGRRVWPRMNIFQAYLHSCLAGCYFDQ